MRCFTDRIVDLALGTERREPDSNDSIVQVPPLIQAAVTPLAPLQLGQSVSGISRVSGGLTSTSTIPQNTGAGSTNLISLGRGYWRIACQATIITNWSGDSGHTWQMFIIGNNVVLGIVVLMPQNANSIVGQNYNFFNLRDDTYQLGISWPATGAGQVLDWVATFSYEKII